MLHEDTEFKETTKHTFTTIINHLVTQDYIARMLENYRTSLSAIDYPGSEEYIGLLKTFFARRIPFLLGEIEQYFPSEPAVVCEVTSDSYPIRVDGYLKEGPYQGYYFPGSKLTVIPEEPNKISEWIVNGEAALMEQIDIAIAGGQKCQIHSLH